MAVKRLWDPKSPHGMGQAIDAGDGLFWDGSALAIGEGWGIDVTADGVAADQAELDARYLEVSVGSAPPVGDGYNLWINPDEEWPEVSAAEQATLAMVKALHAEMATLRARVSELSAR